MATVCVVVTTKNAAATLPRCLSSASFCDEIVVVDSGSDDGTVDVARSFGAKVFVRHYKNAADQKNWALQHVHSDWVLVLDSDEWLSDEAAGAVRRVVAANRPYAYRIRRVSRFLGREVRHAWRHDYPLRLFPRGSGRWDNRRVHADFLCSLPVRRLETPLYHDVAETLSAYLPRWLRHIEMAAEDLAERGGCSLLKGLLSAGWRLLRQYVLQCGWLDGRAGLYVALLSAGSVLLRHMLARDIRAAGSSAPSN
ncbi:MAG: hypothetical protein DRP63_01015 [Planctomycetota bacterium]|nr:MAG: hypothetical protein DRP63_01015 [Planctomycetota bacterium]